MSFWGELKRRKVVQVAAVYAITAWLLVQIIVAIEEPLSLPGWMDTFVIVCLAIGFPITVIISWAFNLTPEGLVRDRGGSSMPASRRSLEYTLIGLLALAVAWLLYRDVSSSSPPALAASSALTPARDARRIVTEIEALGADLDIGAGAWALAYLAIGDRERALRWLERGAEKAQRKEFDPAFIALMHLRLNPFSDPVLEQPEFREIRDRLRGA